MRHATNRCFQVRRRRSEVLVENGVPSRQRGGHGHASFGGPEGRGTRYTRERGACTRTGGGVSNVHDGAAQWLRSGPSLGTTGRTNRRT